GEAREELIALLGTRSGAITDEEWLHLLREAYGNESTINVSSLRWLLIISGRDPQTLRSLLLMGKQVRTSPPPTRPLDMPKIGIPKQTPDTADGRVAELVAALKAGNDQGKQDRAAQYLMNIGPPAVGPLIAELKSTDRATKLRIVRILGVIGDPRSVYPLTECLRNPDREVRKSAADALGKIGDPRARLLLMRAQRDRDPAVKHAVRKALEKLRDDR
ncbi:MAG: HEAT repeat domain-containing protein, partial [Candidatus Methanomethylophilaceae archaeon]|nr:HEAT repeat domain-containing protein [Candidatus Methanomethylophilaceae archaeon]